MFGRRTKAKAAGGAGKVAGGAGRTLFRSGAARSAVRGGGKAAGKATLGAGKAAVGAGRTLLRSGAARKATRGAGKTALKGGVRALTPKEPASIRFLKYGFFALAGFAVGALVARWGEKEVSSSFTEETWGTPQTPVGSTGAGTISDPAAPQRPEDPNRTGAEREYSDPSSGPLIGRQHQPVGDIPEQQQEVEQRIRSRIGTDPRTAAVPKVNVEVNDGVVDLRGEVHSEDERAAVEDIATDTEGVVEVRNLLTVNPQSPTRNRQAGGGEPEQP